MSKPSLQIFVLTQGFIIVGYGEYTGSEWMVRKAQQITRWTEKCGIGGVGNLGPVKSGTTLHPQGDTFVPVGALVQRINCNEDMWQPHLT